MLCSGCRRALLRRARSFALTPTSTNITKSSIRYAATVPSTSNAPPSTPPLSTARDDKTSPSATSSATPGASQPFSEAFFPSSVAESSASRTQAGQQEQNQKAARSKKPSAASPKSLSSSVPGGAELKGLGYTKANPIIYAKEDDEYPAWLWTILDQPKAGDDPTKPSDTVDVASMTKKQRAKHERKQAKLLAGVEKPIPVHEQSKDLTGPEDDAVTSLDRRQEITKSARAARRKEIRENNFLRTM